MPINDFIWFGTGVGSNVEAQATYVADTTTLGGYLAGLAVSAKLNKSWRQGAMTSSALGQLVNSILGIDFLDDGIVNNKAIEWWEMALTAGYFIDTGSASAIVIANPAGFTFAAPFPGQRISVKMAAAPTGAVTLNWCSTGLIAAVLGDLSAFQKDDYAVGEILDFEFDGTRWQLVSPSIAIIKRLGGPTSGGIPLPGNTTFYVNASTGVDATTGGTIGAPWRTLQYAYNQVQATYNAAGFVITFNCTGSYSAGVSMTKAIIGAQGIGQVLWSFQSGAAVSTSVGACVSASGSGILASVIGVSTTFTSSGTPNLSTSIGVGIVATNGAQVYYNGGITFNCTCTAFGAVGTGGFVNVNGNYTLAAVTSQAMFFAESQAEILATVGITANVNGANFSIAAVVAEVFGYITQGNTTAITFVGSATGQRYLSILTSIIFTGSSGASYYPGNSPGSNDATSVYG